MPQTESDPRLVRAALEREKYFKNKLIMDQHTLQKYHPACNPQFVKDADPFFLLRELTHVESQMIEYMPTGKSHRRLWKVENIGPGFQSINYEELLRSGESKYTAYGETDIPNANASRTSTPSPVRKAKIKYTFELEDIEAMQRSGMSLSAQQALAAKEGNEETFGNTAFFGNASLGLYGYFSYATANNPAGAAALNVIAPTNGAAGTPEWSTKLPEEILDDVKKIKIASDVATESAIDSNVLAVGTEQYNLLKFTYFNQTQTGETILDRIIRKGIFDRVEKCPELNYINSDFTQAKTAAERAASVSAAIAFSDRSDVFKRHIPLELTAIPLQVSGFTHTVYCHADDGGLLMYRKYGGSYLLSV